MNLKQRFALGPAADYSPVQVEFALNCEGVYFRPLNEKSTALEISLNQALTLVQLQTARPSIKWYGRSFTPKRAVEALHLTSLADDRNPEWDSDALEVINWGPDLIEQADNLPMFDYIVLPEVWNWLDYEQQTQMLKFAYHKLKLGGILFLSYDTESGGINFASKLQKAKTSEDDQDRILIKEFTQKRTELLKLHPELTGVFDNWEIEHFSFEQSDELYIPARFDTVYSQLSEAKFNYACQADMSDYLLEPSLLEDINTLPVTLREEVKDLILTRTYRCDLYVKGLCSGGNDEVIKNLARLENRAFFFVYPRNRQAYDAFIESLTKPSQEVIRSLMHNLTSHPIIEFKNLFHKTQGEKFSKETLTVLKELVGKGCLIPCVSSDKAESTAISCIQLNKHLLKTRAEQQAVTLASHVLGGAVSLSAEEVIFYNVYKQLVSSDTNVSIKRMFLAVETRLQQLGLKEYTDKQLNEMVAIFLDRLPLLEALELFRQKPGQWSDGSWGTGSWSQ